MQLPVIMHPACSPVPPLVHKLSHTNPVHKHTTYCNNVIPSTPMSSQFPLPCRFPNQNSARSSLLFHIVWSISYGLYRMVHIVWSISYGPYRMVHIVWSTSVISSSSMIKYNDICTQCNTTIYMLYQWLPVSATTAIIMPFHK